MKKYFAKDSAGEVAVLFVDENGKAVYINNTAFDEKLTLDVAERADYSNFDNCKNAEEAAANYYTGQNLIDFDENDWEELIEF